MPMETMIKEANKTFGEGTIRTMSDVTPSTVDVIPTGLVSLDVAIGCGGYPRGRILELFGPEGSGKSTLALLAIAEAQKKGLPAYYIDVEHALDPNLVDIMGVDKDSLYISQPNGGEEALSLAYESINSGDVGLVIVDSVAALCPNAENEGEMSDNQMGALPRLMGKAMRMLTPVVGRNRATLIFINQIRMKIGVVYGNPEVTPGGNALKFQAALRIEVRKHGDIKNDDKVIGHTMKCKIAKNKVSAPYGIAEIDLIYGQRPDPVADLVKAAIMRSIIVRKGAWYTMGETSLGQGIGGARNALLADKALMEQVTNRLMS